MTLFSQCKTQEEVDKEYRRLAKIYHPDMGGSNEKMADLTKQYEKWKPPTEWGSNSFNWQYAYIDPSSHAPHGFKYNNMNTTGYTTSTNGYTTDGYTTTQQYQKKQQEDALRKGAELEAEIIRLRNELNRAQNATTFVDKRYYSKIVEIEILEKACKNKNREIDELNDELSVIKNRSFYERLFCAFFGEP
jgi:hypothetical protein